MTVPLPAGYRAIRLDEVGSTNATAFDRAAEGERGGLWVVAVRQSAGRGRLGRAWASEPGNLYSTLLLDGDLPEERLPTLPLVVALAVHDAIASALPPPLRAHLAIKWPNDVLYDGAKISGILVEGAFQGGVRKVAIGIGINCRHHPDPALYRATDLASIGVAVIADEMLTLLAAAMAERLATWRQGAFAPLREAWLARARGVGEAISVRLSSGTREGVFDGLDPTGRLLLRHDGQVEAISAGDVFFPGGAGGA